MNNIATTMQDTPVRDRLLEAAGRLFYKEGVRAVGIDRVLAEAGAAKASLYSNFGCKDELVAAYVAHRSESARQAIDNYVTDTPPAKRALRFFDFLVDWIGSDDFRGCPMQLVVGELPDASHPARRLAAEHREWLVGRLAEWATAAGAAHPKRIAGVLLVLFDGAVAASLQDGPQRASEARWAAERLLAA